MSCRAFKIILHDHLFVISLFSILAIIAAVAYPLGYVLQYVTGVQEKGFLLWLAGIPVFIFLSMALILIIGFCFVIYLLISYCRLAWLNAKVRAEYDSSQETQELSV